MTREGLETLRVGRKTGALLGAVVFMVFGIVPSFYFGSYAAVVLLSTLTGGPLEAGVLVRILIVGGTLLGLFCAAAVSIVAGSVIGTALAYVTTVVRIPARAREKTAAE